MTRARLRDRAARLYMIRARLLDSAARLAMIRARLRDRAARHHTFAARAQVLTARLPPEAAHYKSSISRFYLRPLELSSVAFLMNGPSLITLTLSIKYPL